MEFWVKCLQPTLHNRQYASFVGFDNEQRTKEELGEKTRLLLKTVVRPKQNLWLQQRHIRNGEEMKNTSVSNPTATVQVTRSYRWLGVKHTLCSDLRSPKATSLLLKSFR